MSLDWRHVELSYELATRDPRRVPITQQRDYSQIIARCESIALTIRDEKLLTAGVVLELVELLEAGDVRHMAGPRGGPAQIEQVHERFAPSAIFGCELIAINYFITA